MMKDHSHTLAIVGTGPRGQYALECFVHELSKVDASFKIAITLFEETAHSGSGPVWATDQPDGNWSNVTERVLDLPERSDIRLDTVNIPAFPSYHSWAGLKFETWPAERVDTFPPRGYIGSYLAERYQTLVNPLFKAGLVTFVNARVDDIKRLDNSLSIITSGNDVYTADQVLLTVGHQSTNMDPQIEAWLKQSAQSTALRLFPDAYPVEHIIGSFDDTTDVTVGIRGYGLATIDVLRAIAAHYGKFEVDDDHTRAQTFSLMDGITLRVAPFTLDGLTMGPKPLTPRIDAQFAPSAAMIEALDARLSNRSAQMEATDASLLLDAICPMIAQVYLNLESKPKGAPLSQEEVKQLVRAWIEDPTFVHDSILDVSLRPEDVLDALLNMATGTSGITLDYCIGQVWRHLQPTIYKALSHSNIPDDALAQMIAVDESMKRYAFGPPAESLQQLKALHAAGVLDLRFLDNPEIDCDASGWTISNGTVSLTASIMIDAVLDAPKIKAVNSSLLESLLNTGLLHAVHDDFGVSTTSDAFVVNDFKVDPPIAVLGRLAKGTVIGVDAILECFGVRPKDWARAAVAKVKS